MNSIVSAVGGKFQYLKTSPAIVHSLYLLDINLNRLQGKFFIFLILFPQLESTRVPENDARSVRFFHEKSVFSVQKKEGL